MKKKLLIALMICGILGLGVASIVQFMPQSKVGKAIIGTVMSTIDPAKRDANKEKGIVVAAPALAKEYTADEKIADTKYLNKAIEVTGCVCETDKNQDGGVMVILKTADSTGGIQCAMRDKNTAATKGQNITIKGFCSGNGITGVSLTDCIVK